MRRWIAKPPQRLALGTCTWYLVLGTWYLVLGIWQMQAANPLACLKSMPEQCWRNADTIQAISLGVLGQACAGQSAHLPCSIYAR